MEAEAADLRKKLDKAERDLAGTQAERDNLLDRANRATSDLNAANSRRIQAEKEANGLRDELETALKVSVFWERFKRNIFFDWNWV